MGENESTGVKEKSDISGLVYDGVSEIREDRREGRWEEVR